MTKWIPAMTVNYKYDVNLSKGHWEKRNGKCKAHVK